MQQSPELFLNMDITSITTRIRCFCACRIDFWSEVGWSEWVGREEESRKFGCPTGVPINWKAITDPQALTGADRTDRTPETAAIGAKGAGGRESLHKSSGESTTSTTCHPLHLGHVGRPAHVLATMSKLDGIRDEPHTPSC
jgi:hypothetical protein